MLNVLKFCLVVLWKCSVSGVLFMFWLLCVWVIVFDRWVLIEWFVLWIRKWCLLLSLLVIVGVSSLFICVVRLFGDLYRCWVV